MSIAITGAAGQLGRLVIDDLLSAGIPGTDLNAIARPRPEIGHLDETDRCGHRMRRVYCRSTTRCEWTQMLRSYMINETRRGIDA
jgi:nucleoside-diphosphate-sugar epimerase